MQVCIQRISFSGEEKSVEKRQVINSNEFFIFYKQLLKTREEDIFVNLELLEGFQLWTWKKKSSDSRFILIYVGHELENIIQSLHSLHYLS